MGKAIRLMRYKPKHMKTKYTVAQKRRAVVKAVEVLITVAGTGLMFAGALSVIAWLYDALRAAPWW